MCFFCFLYVLYLFSFCLPVPWLLRKIMPKGESLFQKCHQLKLERPTVMHEFIRVGLKHSYVGLMPKLVNGWFLAQPSGHDGKRGVMTAQHQIEQPNIK